MRGCVILAEGADESDLVKVSIFLADACRKTGSFDVAISWLLRSKSRIGDRELCHRIDKEIATLQLNSGRFVEAGAILDRLAGGDGVFYRGEYVAYQALQKYVSGQRTEYERLVNRGLVWETELASAFSPEDFAQWLIPFMPVTRYVDG